MEQVKSSKSNTNNNNNSNKKVNAASIETNKNNVKQEQEQQASEVTTNANANANTNTNTNTNTNVNIQENAAKTPTRSIGRWYIGETLGKGGYSWVKKGYDKKTSRRVALKFIAKADKSWSEEQMKQVMTEIDALKQIRHENVMKLFAYNLNAKYPTQKEEKIDTILLVLEFAPGGELFDILYYTSALDAVVARTYFRQLIAGLEACHNAGVAHRDLKPQNLLLDGKFNLKITDFGLSKLFEPSTGAKMKTSYVGTRGYQAPELLLKRPYDVSADIFSSGVVLFILLNGYPPFEQAHKTDRWFRPLAKRDYSKFWELHAGCPIANDDDAKDLLQRMLAYNPRHRITIAEIKQHKWFTDKVLEGKELINILQTRYRQMEQKRKKDAKKLKDLQNSLTRTIEGLNSHETEVPLYPLGEVEGIWDTYTTAKWKDVYNAVNTVVYEVAGHTVYDFDTNTLLCSMKLQNPHGEKSLVRFRVQVFRSRVFQNGPSDTYSDSEGEDDVNNHNSEVVYIVKFRRLEGDVLDWKKILNQVIYKKCTTVLTGLPKWATRQLKKENSKSVEENRQNNLLIQQVKVF